MKKLMIAAAIVCAAAVSQAATVTWGSGSSIHYNGDGSFVDGSDKGAVVANGTTMMYVFSMVDDGDNDAAAMYAVTRNWALADILANFDASAKTLTVNGTSYDFFGSAAAVDGVANVGNESGYTRHDAVYGISILTYDGDMDGTIDAYSISWGSNDDLTNSGENFTGMALADLDQYDGGAKTTWMATAVPEPTSGLLLLLGVAGLALRRRRA